MTRRATTQAIAAAEPTGDSDAVRIGISLTPGRMPQIARLDWWRRLRKT